MKRTDGDKIRTERIGKHIKQAELAEASGYDQTTISDVESGRNACGKTVAHIAAVLRRMPTQPRWRRNRGRRAA